MSEEVKIKISQPMFEVGELERFDNNIHSIVEEYSKMKVHEKEQILTQRIIIKKEEINSLYYCLLKLKDKEIEVISSYFGLGREKITLEEIAKNLNTSKQVISVIKKRALNKLWLYIRKERRKL